MGAERMALLLGGLGGLLQLSLVCPRHALARCARMRLGEPLQSISTASRSRTATTSALSATRAVARERGVSRRPVAQDNAHQRCSCNVHRGWPPQGSLEAQLTALLHAARHGSADGPARARAQHLEELRVYINSRLAARMQRRRVGLCLDWRPGARVCANARGAGNVPAAVGTQALHRMVRRARPAARQARFRPLTASLQPDAARVPPATRQLRLRCHHLCAPPAAADGVDEPALEMLDAGVSEHAAPVAASVNPGVFEVPRQADA